MNNFYNTPINTAVITPLTELKTIETSLVQTKIDCLKLLKFHEFEPEKRFAAIKFMLAAPVSVLDFSNLQLTSAHLAQIVRIWEKLLAKGQGKSIQTINLNNNYIGSRTPPTPEIMSSHTSLMYGDTDGLNALLRLVDKTWLISLELANNLLNARHCETLCKWLRNLPHRDFYLNLTFNPLCFYLWQYVSSDRIMNESSNRLDCRPQLGVNALPDLLTQSSQRYLSFEILPTLIDIHTPDQNQDEKEPERLKIIKSLFTRRQQFIHGKLSEIEIKFQNHNHKRIANTRQALDFLPVVIANLVMESLFHSSAFFKKSAPSQTAASRLTNFLSLGT